MSFYKPVQGTNAYKKKYEPWKKELYRGIILCSLIFSLFYLHADKKIVRPVQDFVIVAASEAPQGKDRHAFLDASDEVTATSDVVTLPKIVSYIAEVFKPEGKAVVVWAITCFYSESGLRTEAVNDGNSNGSVDRGVAQVNSIHGYDPETLHTLKGNIDAAYEIYKRQGRGAWYGTSCN